MGKGVVTAFEKLFRKNKAPKKCWGDFGKEFWDSQVANVFKQYSVHLYKTENEIKSCIVERWIRSMKRMMYKYFTAARTRNYISVIHKMVDKYNSTYHRSIEMTPNKAREEDNFQSVFNHLYPDTKKEEVEEKGWFEDQI